MTIKELVKVTKEELDRGSDLDQILDYLLVKYRIHKDWDILQMGEDSDEVEKLKKKVEDLEYEESKLRDEVDELEYRNDKLQSKCEDLQELVDRLESRVEELEKS
jgi:predicted  nucleic acid-binding Zn-ribbon protein